jgi:ribosomal protein L11 methyltransferase
MDSAGYWMYTFHLAGEPMERLLCRLEELPFNGFLEAETSLTGYLPIGLTDVALEEEIQTIIADFSCPWERELLPDQNWNEQWEAAFQPVQVGDFVGVRAEFHPSFTGVTYELLIHPRMAFGTGHHATTYLMMERMGELEWPDKSVFDFGCGTGILAILAQKLGAGATDAVDIEPPATENTLVNMAANQVTEIAVYTGDLSVVPVRKYQVILANINRNVILASLGALYDRTEAGGDLLVSGILRQDQALVEAEATLHGWKKVCQREREGWLMLHYQRPQ